MNKISGISLFVAVVACSGVAFSVVELRKMSASMASLEDKVAKLETSGGPAGGSTASTGGGASGSATIADVNKELASLKTELSAVKSEQEAIAASAKTSPPPTTGGTGAKSVPQTPEEWTAAVEAVLAKKEAEKKAADEKQRTDMAARMAQGMVDYLGKELGLTEQQKTQVTDIIAAQTTAFRDLWTNRKEGDDVRSKMGDLKTETDQKIKAVLTPEQGTKYDDIAKNGQLFGGFGGMGGGGGRRGGTRGGGDNGNQ